MRAGTVDCMIALREGQAGLPIGGLVGLAQELPLPGQQFVQHDVGRSERAPWDRAR